jgi:hypothetical protein
MDQLLVKQLLIDPGLATTVEQYGFSLRIKSKGDAPLAIRQGDS